MLSLEIDQEVVERAFKEELRRRLDQLEESVTIWDTKELQRQTNMSINTMKEWFFYDERFPKYRVGSKWYFPAKECAEFLVKWIKEQPQN